MTTESAPLVRSTVTTNPRKGKIMTHYTHQQLDEMFKRVANPDDWRAPIDCVVGSAGEMMLATAAIVFFTGTQPDIAVASGGERPHYRLTSVGYREGPCGP